MIVDGKVRIIDVDGSYQEQPIQFVLDIYEWVGKHRMRLVEELRTLSTSENRKKKEREA